MTGIGRATRIYQNDKGNYVVAFENEKRRTVTIAFPDFNTAKGIAGRIQENGNPRRDFR